MLILVCLMLVAVIGLRWFSEWRVDKRLWFWVRCGCLFVFVSKVVVLSLFL